MSISDAELKTTLSYIKVAETVTLTDAFTRLKKANGRGRWKLIVERAGGIWDVASFSDLDTLAITMGPDFFTIPIADLPIEFDRPLTREQNNLDYDTAEQLAQASAGNLVIITLNGQF